MAPLVRTGGSRHTGLAALPHRNIHGAGGIYSGNPVLFSGADCDLPGPGSMDLPGTGGKKECAVLAGFPVCFFFQGNAGAGSDLYCVFRAPEDL